MDRFDDDGKVARFEGFPDEGMRFLRQLKRNNRRDWFKPRKHIYETALREPLAALLFELRDKLVRKLPGLRFDERSGIFRIYRDTRFSEDKTPYKTHVTGYVSFPRGRSKVERPCFYLHVEPAEAWFGAGLYLPSTEQLARIRRSIDENPRAFERIVDNPVLLKRFGGLAGERLKRAPQGYRADHRYLRHLQWKQFFMGKAFPASLLKSRRLLTVVAEHAALLVPLVKWLDEAVRE